MKFRGKSNLSGVRFIDVIVSVIRLRGKHQQDSILIELHGVPVYWLNEQPEIGARQNHVFFDNAVVHVNTHSAVYRDKELPCAVVAVAATYALICAGYPENAFNFKREYILGHRKCATSILEMG